MSNFKRRKIRTGTPLVILPKSFTEKFKQHLASAIGVLLLLLVIYYSGAYVLDKLGGLKIVQLISAVFGKSLAMDEKMHTNILVLGIGGEGHEGKDLTDTIMIASLDHENNSVGMVSIPRDLYVQSSIGGSRINKLYEQAKLKWNAPGALDFVRENLEKTFELPLHYSIKVDFEAFEKVVNSVGGIDIYVDETINDPAYPKDGTYDYELFYLEKGSQHLDGKTALKYARSRKTSSDFDRSKRQHKVLIALKSKASQLSSSGRKDLLKELYYSLQEHVETNLSVREMITLADFAASWDSKKLSTATINDEPTFAGGFLYTPLRDLFGGAYVLLPASDTFTHVNSFIRLVLYGPVQRSALPIAVLNGTGEHGLAGQLKTVLNRFGVQITTIGNARNETLNETTWYSKGNEATSLLPFVQQVVPGLAGDALPPEYQNDPALADAQLILEVGKDLLPKMKNLDIFRNVVELTPTTETTSPAEAAQSEAKKNPLTP